MLPSPPVYVRALRRIARTPGVIAAARFNRARTVLAIALAAVATAASVTLGILASAASRGASMVPASHISPAAPAALAGRLGGHVDSFDSVYRLAGAAARGAGPIGLETDPYRRVYAMPDAAGSPGARVVAEVLAAGRVRQLTIGRERAVQETWQGAPDDWTLEQAQRVAGRWLPSDATFVRREPFGFQDRIAGTRDVYFSASLAKVATAADYAAMRASGPPGTCSTAYYQTGDGGVAFVLVGLY